MQAVVTTKGQIVIPSKLRRRFNIKKGTRVYIEEGEDEIIIKPVTPEYLKNIAGVLSVEEKLSQKLLKERRHDREKEDKQ